MIEEEKIVKDPFDEPLEPPESVERLILVNANIYLSHFPAK